MENLLREESGQGLVEYGLIIALIGIALIAVVERQGLFIKNSLNDSTNKMNHAAKEAMKDLN